MVDNTNPDEMITTYTTVDYKSVVIHKVNPIMSR